jgi:hypothetical protein
MAEEKRKFEGPNGKVYYIATPTAEDIRGADWNYSKTYTRTLIDGITTSSEMMDILMRRGVIGPEFEQRQSELNTQLAEKVMELQTSEDIDKKQLLAIEVADLREELFTWNQRLNGPMSNTCEQIADDARLEYLTSRIIENEDGAKVWEDYDSFLKEKDQGLAIRSRFEVMLYLQGLEPDFLEKTPEAVALKEVEDEIRNKASEAIEKIDKENKSRESKSNKEKSVKPKTGTRTKPKTTITEPNTVDIDSEVIDDKAKL